MGPHSDGESRSACEMTQSGTLIVCVPQWRKLDLKIKLNYTQDDRSVFGCIYVLLLFLLHKKRMTHPCSTGRSV